MKQRSPLTLEGAICRVKDILGATTVAQLLDISESMVYKRCDAEHAAGLRLADAIKLDIACRERCGETPLAEYLVWHVEQSARPIEIKESLASAALKLGAEVGQVEEEVHQLLDQDTDKMHPISNRKVIDIQSGLKNVKRCIDGMEKIVSAAATKK